MTHGFLFFRAMFSRERKTHPNWNKSKSVLLTGPNPTQGSIFLDKHIIAIAKNIFSFKKLVTSSPISLIYIKTQPQQAVANQLS
jgi:hypothetical protein